MDDYGSSDEGILNIGSAWVVSAFMLMLSLSGDLWAEPDVVVSGLFKNKALLAIDGKSRLLKAGETSPEGVKLVSSDSKRAVVVIDGKQTTLQVSQRISASFSAAKFAEVKILRGPNGHFNTSGAINGYPTQFMIDTGATAVAMNINDAKRLGIDIKTGVVSTASTAGGVVKTYVVSLSKVSVGAITVHDIPATVVDGNHPVQVLLGNTFLSRVEMSEQAGVMVLKQKF